MYFQSPTAVGKYVKFLKDEMVNESTSGDTGDFPETETQPDVDVYEFDCLWDFHEEEVRMQQQTDKSAPGSSMEAEFRKFLNDPVMPRNTNPFEAWEVLKNEFPNVYKQAMKYLPTLATSVPSERLFSVVKLVRNERRSRLTADHSHQLVVLGSLSERM